MHMKQFKSEDKGLNKKNNKESGNRRKWICGILAVLLLVVLIWLLHLGLYSVPRVWLFAN